eukprot:gnl/MRDRNA2_/MRDRNA2_93474_c0_seq1.p1 gnl/MRDRNA2_/MRDRNA2_93474_c0~~gnl/MRDRNA2_/MRDRNA2_93474_c0_seq1.p1  ORF type:complete len:190 (-),score=20.89 gnl/MRDRNA2_/MRDRNA2_93474_c0_seq1:13-582(-)
MAMWSHILVMVGILDGAASDAVSGKRLCRTNTNNMTSCCDISEGTQCCETPLKFSNCMTKMISETTLCFDEINLMMKVNQPAGNLTYELEMVPDSKKQGHWKGHLNDLFGKEEGKLLHFLREDLVASPIPPKAGKAPSDATKEDVELVPLLVAFVAGISVACLMFWLGGYTQSSGTSASKSGYSQLLLS